MMKEAKASKRPSDLEFRLQRGIVNWLFGEQRNRQFEFAAGLEGLRLGIGLSKKARQMGMQRGEPDLRIYLPGGRLVMIELKYGDNTASDVQIDRHEDLRKLGFEVHVVSGVRVDDTCREIARILGWL